MCTYYSRIYDGFSFNISLLTFQRKKLLSRRRKNPHPLLYALEIYEKEEKTRISYISDIKPTCLRWNIWRSTISGVKNSHSQRGVCVASTHPPLSKKKEKIARFRRREKNVYVHIEVKMEVIFLYYVYTHTWYPHVLFPPPKLTPRNPPLESTPVPFHEPTHRNHPHEPSPWRTVQGDDMAAVEDGADIVLKEIVRHEMPFTTHNYWRKKGIFLFFGKKLRSDKR